MTEKVQKNRSRIIVFVENVKKSQQHRALASLMFSIFSSLTTVLRIASVVIYGKHIRPCDGRFSPVLHLKLMNRLCLREFNYQSWIDNQRFCLELAVVARVLFASLRRATRQAILPSRYNERCGRLFHSHYQKWRWRDEKRARERKRGATRNWRNYDFKRLSPCPLPVLPVRPLPSDGGGRKRACKRRPLSLFASPKLPRSTTESQL